jgi:two-component system OmpR family response regulator
MARPKTILVVDDDASIREVIKFALEKSGFQAIEATDGEQALTVFAAEAPDLVLLDVMMPELDGTEVCKRLRATSRVPIIFLSSRDDEIDRVLGLELGGDDYITKPFSPREMVARVKAVLRRFEPIPPAPPTSPAPEEQLTHGELRLDLVRIKAYWGEHEVELTVTEFGMLRTLMSYPGKVYSRDELMRHAYRDHTIVSDRTIDSHITRLRRKFERLGADPIKTVHGLGYCCHEPS